MSGSAAKSSSLRIVGFPNGITVGSETQECVQSATVFGSTELKIVQVAFEK